MKDCITVPLVSFSVHRPALRQHQQIERRHALFG